MGDNILADREVVLAAVESHFPALEYAAKSLWNDHAFVYSVVQADWTLLERASPLVRADPFIVSAAASQDLRAFPLSNLGMNTDPGQIRFREVGVLPSWYPPEWIKSPRTRFAKAGKKQTALGAEIAGSLSPTMRKKTGSKVAWTDFEKEPSSEQATTQAATDQIYQALLQKRERRAASKKAKASCADREVKCSW